MWQCFVEEQYQIPTVRGVPPVHRPSVTDIHKQILADGKIPLILDCGANIGASAAWFNMKYERSAIIAIEPAPDNCQMLRRNIGSFPNIGIVEAGIRSLDAASFLQDLGYGNWGYKTSETLSDTKADQIPIDTVLRGRSDKIFQPFILKIDIEGAELDLFSGSWPTINLFPLIITKPHDFCMPGQSTSNSFFKFHSAMNREFLFGFENVFSFRMDLLHRPPGSMDQRRSPAA